MTDRVGNQNIMYMACKDNAGWTVASREVLTIDIDHGLCSSLYQRATRRRKAVMLAGQRRA